MIAAPLNLTPNGSPETRIFTLRIDAEGSEPMLKVVGAPSGSLPKRIYTVLEVFLRLQDLAQNVTMSTPF